MVIRVCSDKTGKIYYIMVEMLLQQQNRKDLIEKEGRLNANR